METAGKIWDWTKWGVAQIAVFPISFYEYVKNYPGQVVVLWPLSVFVAWYFF